MSTTTHASSQTVHHDGGTGTEHELHIKQAIDVANSQYRDLIEHLPQKVTSKLCSYCGHDGDTWSPLIPELFVGPHTEHRATSGDIDRQPTNSPTPLKYNLNKT
jgi:hypothetical protein